MGVIELNSSKFEIIQSADFFFYSSFFSKRNLSNCYSAFRKLFFKKNMSHLKQ